VQLTIKDHHFIPEQVTVPSGERFRIEVMNENPPRLHRQRISRHDDMIGEPAATFGAAEAQILQRAVALPGIDDSLQISRRLVAAGFALGTDRSAAACCARSVGCQSLVGSDPPYDLAEQLVGLLTGAAVRLRSSSSSRWASIVFRGFFGSTIAERVSSRITGPRRFFIGAGMTIAAQAIRCFRLLRDRQVFGSLSGVAMLPRIIAAARWNPLTR
jgi:hypothetical protein